MDERENERQPCATSGVSKSVGFYEALLDAIPVPIFYKNTCGLFTGCNNSFLRFTGLSRDKIIGKTIYELIPRKTAEEYSIQEQKVLGERQALNYESAFPHADNSDHDVIVHLEPLFNRKRELTGLIGVVVDITERKKIERELKESHAELGIRVRVRTAELAKANEDLHSEIDEHRRTEEKLKCSEARYRAIIEEHPELIVRMTPDFVITFINEAFRSYYCQARDECLGADFITFLPPGSREQVRSILTSLSVLQPTVSTEVPLPKPAGGEHWQLWIHRGIFDDQGRCIEIQSIGRDITKRKEIEHALDKNERFLEDVLAAVSDQMAVVDTQMNIVRTNAATAKHAVDKGPLAGKKCYRAIHGQAVPCEGCPVIETLRTGQPASAFMMMSRSATRAAHWYEINSFPWRASKGGAMIGAIEYCRDITDKRRLEDRMTHLRRQLLATERQTERLQESERRMRLRAAHVSVVDKLTGISSLRFMHDFVERESARAAREGWNFALLVVDIDHFRTVNQVYGRAFADEILKQFAHCLKRTMRRYDCISRHEDEFIIVASGIDRERLMSLAQRIRETVALHNFGTKARIVKLTATVAAVSCPHGVPPDADGLIRSARRLVRASQHSGASNVVVRPGREPGRAAQRENAALSAHLRALAAARRKARNELFKAITAVSGRIARADGYSRPDLASSADCAAKIAASLGLPRDTQEQLRRAAVISDIGKAGIHQSLLRKKGPLDSEEWKQFRLHPQLGVDMLRPLEPLSDLIPLILYHHERWDGSGYPSGARGEDIPIGARIIGLVDVYRALLKPRPYRKALTREKAVALIKKSAGTRFDPTIVCAFLNVVQGKP